MTLNHQNHSAVTNSNLFIVFVNCPINYSLYKDFFTSSLYAGGVMSHENAHFSQKRETEIANRL